MEQVANNHSFQIILQSDNGDNLSEYWQDQCKYLFDELSSVLPEGSIKPLILESSEGEKAVDLTYFSTLVVNELAPKFFAFVFVETIIEAFKNWFEYRKNSNIELKYPDGNIIELSISCLSELLKYSKENPQLSISEVLDHLKNFKE